MKAMTDDGDEWTTAALNDGALVAELLLNLNKQTLYRTPPLTWRVRLPRSKKTDSVSPTTPLSWTTATSASGGGAGGGVELSSTSVAPPNERSIKGLAVSENTASKRSRKKKTLAELKEDEVLILKERCDLKKKLASLHVTVAIERATNDRLKRLKLNCISSLSAKRVALLAPAKEIPKTVPSKFPFSADLRFKTSKSVAQLTLSDPTKPNDEVMNQENKFVLPDLNLPIEDHITT